MDGYLVFCKSAHTQERYYVKGQREMTYGKHKDQSDPRQRWLVSEVYREPSMLLVFPTKRAAKKAAIFAAANPWAGPLQVLEAGER